ncbi:MAG: IniB N-terminal domain-containing protein [Acidimicrobiales bacterium]
MSTTSNLVEFFQALFGDPAEAAAFQADPQKYIEDHGVEDASYEEINEAVVLACDAPVSQGAVVTGGTASAVVPQVLSGSVSAPTSSAPAAPAASAPVAPPPPPPAPPASMPPAEAVSQVVNYYVTEVYETTNVDDRDTYTDNSVTTNVNAEDGAHVDITNDNDTVTASGDGAVAGGEDSDFEGVATGDGAVAAGDDIDGNVNTGTNTGVIGDDADIDDSIFGDGNTQVNDAEGTVVLGDDNVTATGGSQAAGDDLSDDDITIDDSDLNGSNVGGSGNTAVQDNDTSISDDDVTTTVTDIDTTVTTDIDNSVDNSIDDSFNATDSFDTDNSVNDSFTAEDSFNTDASTDIDVDDVEIDL